MRASAVVVSIALVTAGVFLPSAVLAIRSVPFASDEAAPALSSLPSGVLSTGGLTSRAAFRAGSARSDAATGQLVTPAPEADGIAEWWAGLDDVERAAISTSEPTTIGNLDGVPYDVRDSLNRITLESDIAEVRESLDDGLGTAASVAAAQRLAMLEQIDKALQPSVGGPQRRLLVLDTEFPGKAAIALGDLEEADYISILVPGALLSVREHMAEWTKVTDDLFAEQQSWEATFGRHDTVATVSWIGYHTPDLTNAISLDLAEQGASSLASFVNGIRALHPGAGPYLSVFAHSYGSTATSMALSRGWMGVDAFAMMGSPGGEVQNVEQLGVPGDNVWVGEAPWDPVVNTAFFGVDPGSPSFGAKRMSVSGSADPITGAFLTASIGHDWYLEPGTESLRNLSLIGIAKGEFVTDGSDDDQLKTLTLLG